MNGNTASQVSSSMSTETMDEGTTTTTTGRRKTVLIICQGKLTAAAQASAVRCSLRSPAIHTSIGRSSGNVFAQAMTIEIAASAQVMPTRAKKVPVPPS